ncbi:hypothetical protein GALL_511790 [mine drainage metagenome]|uniref:Uncharacterized protein n=1 Tax=mine drainage metagenome TaxID=410659 RepID=A0A1J5PUM6_9ZZZZ
MNPMTIFAISGCVLSAGAVYVVMKVIHFGESQVLLDQLLKIRTELETVRKKLLGYTKYADYLEASQQSLVEQIKPMVVKLVREYAHVEPLSKDKTRLKTDATVLVRYSAEFSFGIDVSASSLALTDAADAVHLKVRAPSLSGQPQIKVLSRQAISASELIDPNAVFADIEAKLPAIARSYGSALGSDESLRALCKAKVLQVLHTTLAGQTGVRHLPALVVDFG